jgi:hypothetical protein
MFWTLFLIFMILWGLGVLVFQVIRNRKYSSSRGRSRAAEGMHGKPSPVSPQDRSG